MSAHSRRQWWTDALGGEAIELGVCDLSRWDPHAASFVGPAFDHWLDRRLLRPRWSLNPSVELASPLHRVCRALLPSDTFEFRVRCVASEGLGRFLCAQWLAFPDNLFWDCTAILGELMRTQGHGPEASESLRAAFDALCRLQAIFGSRTAIAFRYGHDFVYGFDWAKWIARSVDDRLGCSAYVGPFVAHCERRSEELLAAIATGDRQYPPLGAGQYRNPFGFNREPDAEARLLRALAREGELPIEAWRGDATERFELRDFASERRSRARALGLDRDR